MTLVSVVIPTYNRLPRLKKVLVALESQQFPLDEVQVVIVSDGSTDGTDEYLSNLSTSLRLTFVPQTNAGPAAARNNGIKHACGEYVLFIDDDIIPAPALIAEHMRLHAIEANLVVLGPMNSPDDFTFSPWVAWEQAMLMKQYEAMVAEKWKPTARQFYTGNTSLSHKHLVEAGGFDERFRRAEDVELAYRLVRQGVQFVFNPQAICYHYAERSFRSWVETPYAYGRNDVIFAREHQEWIFTAVQNEYADRNILTRAIVWTCLDRLRLSQITQAGLKYLADTFYGLGTKRLSQLAYSAIFNLRYYQGMADELGGRKCFFAKAG